MKNYCEQCLTLFNFENGYWNNGADNSWDNEICPVCGEARLKSVPNYETPEQYEKRTGKAYPDNGAVFSRNRNKFVRTEYHGDSFENVYEYTEWELMTYAEYKALLSCYVYVKEIRYRFEAVIADPPVPPPDDWRPE